MPRSSWRVFAPMNWLVLSVLFAVAGVSNLVTALSMDEIDQSITRAENSTVIYGAGPTFEASLLQNEIMTFQVARTQTDSFDLHFLSLSSAQGLCRLKGFKEHCMHPYNPLTPGQDVQEPLFIDYFVTETEIPEQAIGPDLLAVPIFVTGVVPIVNLPGLTRELTLNRPTLTRIFRKCSPPSPTCAAGAITMWNDSAIKALNPTLGTLLDAAGEIKLLVQTTSTAATPVLTRALSRFDPVFHTQTQSNWTGVDLESEPFYSSETIVEAVTATPFSIGYVETSIALKSSQVKRVGIADEEGDHIIHDDERGLQVAFQDLAYSIQGESLDLTTTGALHAWPIAHVKFLVVRRNHLSEMRCLDRMRELLRFLEYVYERSVSRYHSASGGVASIGPQLSQVVLNRLRANLKCNDELVFEFPPAPAQVVIYTPSLMIGTVEILARAFEDLALTSDVTAEIIIAEQRPHLEMVSDWITQDNIGFIALADENLSTDLMQDDSVNRELELLVLPLAVTSSCFIFNFCGPSPSESNCTLNDVSLTLDIKTAALMLEGTISQWNDARIQQLNPGATLPNEPIRVVSGPTNDDFYYDLIQFIRRDYNPQFSFNGVIEERRTYAEVYRTVSVRPFSFAYVPQNGTVEARVQTTFVYSRLNQVVSNDPQNLEACADDTLDFVSKTFHLSASASPRCHPMVNAINLITKRIYKNASIAASRAAIATARFAKFIFAKTTFIKQDETIFDSAGFGTLGNTHEKLQVMRTLNTMTLDDVSILIVPHNLRLIPIELRGVMYAVMVLQIALYLALAIWVGVHRNRKLVRNSSPTFMLQVLLGATLMSLTVVPLGQQDSKQQDGGAVTVEELNPPVPGLDSSCLAQPFVFSFGFAITFSALFLKSWRLIRIFNNKKLKNLFLRDGQLLMYQAGVFLLVIALNLIWAIQSPLEWVRFPIFILPDSQLVVESSGLCYSPQGIYPAIPLILGILVMLLLGNYLAYLGRRIPTEFNESKWTAMAMVVALEALVMGVPVLALANDQPVAGFVVKASICLLISGSTVGLIFLPKVAMAYGWGVLEGDSNPWRFVKGQSSGSNSAANNNKATSKQQSSKREEVNSALHNPSLQSLVSGRVLVSPIPNSVAQQKHHQQVAPALSPQNATSPIRPMSQQLGSSTSAQLRSVLDNDPIRRRFRRYLQTLRMDENVRFYDCITVHRLETDVAKRYISARAVIQTFILDSAPLQVSLSSGTQATLVRAYTSNDKEQLGRDDLFQGAMDELFNDLRQSDAFRNFLENDTFSTAKLSLSDTNLPTGGAAMQ